MYKAHIYLTLDWNGIVPAKRKYIYTLGAEHSGKTVSGSGELTGTMHRVTLTALIEALGRFKENAQITIHAEDRYVLSQITKSLEKWEGNGFRKKDGEPVADAELWKRLAVMAKYQKILTEPGPHTYTQLHQEIMEAG